MELSSEDRSVRLLSLSMLLGPSNGCGRLQTSDSAEKIERRRNRPSNPYRRRKGSNIGDHSCKMSSKRRRNV